MGTAAAAMLVPKSLTIRGIIVVGVMKKVPACRQFNSEHAIATTQLEFPIESISIPYLYTLIPSSSLFPTHPLCHHYH